MDLDEDVWVGRLITATLENIVRELKAEQGPEGVARSSSVESVILANLPTYEEFFNEQSSSFSTSHKYKTEWESYAKSVKNSLIICAVDAAKAAMTKCMSRKEKKKIKKAIGVTTEFKEYTQGRPFKASILPEIVAFVSRKTGLKDAKKRDGDVENAVSLSLVVYNSTDSRRKSPDTDVSASKKRGRFSRFRSLLSRLCCCR